VPSANQQKGLFHSVADLQLARDNLEREPIRGALAGLDMAQADPLAQAHAWALRSQLYDDAEPLYRAADALNSADAAGDGDELESIKRSLAWLSVVAMLRGHPAWASSWRDAISPMLSRYELSAGGLRELWLGALSLAAGILLESADEIERGAAIYRRAIGQGIHPEGYLKGIADVADAPARYEAQVSGCCALAIMAEMAAPVGLDLWSFESRAVGIFTAVTYTHFYYFFPEKWRWEEGLTLARTQAIMRREGAFMELVNRRNPPQGIEQFLAEQRPLFCAWGGGFTTLTHGLSQPKKKRWGFW
jgi:hypothetical protein